MLDNLQSSSSSLKIKTRGELDVEVSNPSKRKKKNLAEVNPPPIVPSSVQTPADEIAFAKSRAILEAKSKLYDEIMANSEMTVLAEDNGDDEDEKSFLVDFEKKIYETNQSNPKVEYKDSFGRTRLVTPDEYERLRALDRQRAAADDDDDDDDRSPPPPKRTENEIARVERLHREQMRSKWEAEMEELRNKTHVHYQDILFDEKRDHGVGFYKFSTNDQQRADQMATLNELRTKTKSEQTKFLDEKEKKQSSMADRLNKIRLRKAKEMGIELNGSDPHRTPVESAEKVSETLDTDHSTYFVWLQPLLSMEEHPASAEPIPRDNSFKEPTRIEIPEMVEGSLKPVRLVSDDKVLPSRDASSDRPLQTTRLHEQPPAASTHRPAPSSNPSFAYPFPVMRATKTADTTSTNSP